MKFLTKVTETYRMNSDEEVKAFLEELKNDPYFEVISYNSKKKEKTKGGEVVDSWILFTVTKRFNKEAEPDFPIAISYERVDY